MYSQLLSAVQLAPHKDARPVLLDEQDKIKIIVSIKVNISIKTEILLILYVLWDRT